MAGLSPSSAAVAAHAENRVAIIVERAVEPRRRAAIDQQQPIGDQPEQMPVVADHHHRPAELGQRLDQSVARLDIEMVGRLIEDQNMRRLAGDQRERQPRPLAARELAHGDIDLVARETEAAELPAHLAWRRIRQQALHMLQRCLVGNELLDLVLGEIADPQLA